MNKKSLIRSLHILGAYMYLFWGASCEKEDYTRSLDKNDEIEIIEEGAGISLIMENDSLEDEIEDIYFNSEEWDEERMNVDL